MRSAITTIASAALLAAAGLASTGAHASNLITNGSFETGDLTGWTSDSGFGLNPFGTTYGAGMDGTYWHWLAGFESPITTFQTVSGLTPGKTYLLSFAMASEASNSDQLRVTIDGGSGTLFSAPPYIAGGPGNGFWNNWVTQSLSFTATGTSATIQFDTVGLNANGYDVGLDNVSLTGTVPEPATWALAIIGFGIAGTSLRRQRAARPVPG